MQNEGQREQTYTDPICGMQVTERGAAAKSEYKGKTYYFCSRGCKVAFDKDPEKALREGPQGHM